MKLIKFFIIMAVAISPFCLNAQDIKLPAPELPSTSFAKCMDHRQTFRDYKPDEVSLQEVSNLLWTAYGYNRMGEKKRTAPSARNVQETDLYVFTTKGVYLYDAANNALKCVVEGDHRSQISSQKHFQVAPVAVVLVANYARMEGFDAESRDFYSAVDCGYVSQNLYLYCATTGKFGTVACGAINRDAITKLLKLKEAKPLLAHPFGYIDK